MTSTAYETVACKGCGASITIRTLESSSDRSAYSLNPQFNADVPCESCEEIYSYGSKDIKLVAGAGF